MTAYDRLRKVQDSQYGLAAAAPSDVAELLTDYAALMLDNDEYSEVVFRTRRELSPDDPFGRRGRDFDDAADTTEVPLYAAPVPAQPAVPEGYTPVRTEVLLWLLGENGDFECPPAQYFRGKPAPYFWRKKLRESMLPASPAQPAVPEDVVRDADRYRAIRANLGHIAWTNEDGVLIGVLCKKAVGEPYNGDRQMDFDAAADAMISASQRKEE